MRIRELKALVDQALDPRARIQVYASDDIAAHSVPRALLAASSPKFAQACSADKSDLTLNASSATIKNFIGWTLTGEVLEKHQSTLAATWLLGAEYEAPALQNAVADRLIGVWKKQPACLKTIKLIYSLKPLGDYGLELRQGFVTQAAYNFTHMPDYNSQEMIRIEGLDGNCAFLQDLAFTMQHAAMTGGHKKMKGAELGDILVQILPEVESEADSGCESD